MRIWIALITSFAFLFSGCALFSSRDKTPSAAEEVVARYVYSLQQEDVGTLFSLLTPDSPDRERLSRDLPLLFTHFDLNYQITEVSLVTSEKNRLLLRTEMRVTRRAGNFFRGQERTDHYELHYLNGEWKIYATEAISTTYL